MSIVRKLNLEELTVDDALTFASLGFKLECNDGQVVGVVEED